MEEVITIKDISRAVLEMPAPRGFIWGDSEHGIRPRYAKSVKALYLIMHWPYISDDDSEIDEESGISGSGMSMYGALMEHGKTHVVEIFMADEKTQKYHGSHKTFSVDFPENKYVEEYDDWLMDELAKKVLGVKREKAVGHNISL